MLKSEFVNIMPNGDILTMEPLSKHTYYKVGGPAHFYLKPKTINELGSLIKIMTKKGYPFFVIGKGSNLLVSDNGFNGAVIDLCNCCQELKLRDEIVYVGSGKILAQLSSFCLKNSLSGFEELIGIPSTIGGAIKGNAGAYGKTISDHLVAVTLMNKEGKIVRILKSDLLFGYRYSSIENIILGAEFKLISKNSKDILQRIKDVSAKRFLSQPLEYPSCGSVFKKGKDYSAGKLLDDNGLKGKSIGGAMISEKHANFFINYNNATASDIYKLIQFAKDEVLRKNKISLCEEVQYIGF